MTRTPVPSEFKASTGSGADTGLSGASNPVGGHVAPTPTNEPVWRREPITEGQRKFINGLRDERDIPAEGIEFLDRQMARTDLTKGYASDIIARLKALPRKPKTPAQDIPEAPTVEEGYYALRFDDDDLNPIRFYRVDHGTGQWAGRTFVKRYASDERYPVKGKTRLEVLTRIADDPQTARDLYARETAHCYVCNRKLTRRASRQAGIGPECASKSEAGSAIYAAATAAVANQGFDPNEVI